jgi:hypothetical protein
MFSGLLLIIAEKGIKFPKAACTKLQLKVGIINAQTLYRLKRFGYI